jgi:ankyrin repeat protein
MKLPYELIDMIISQTGNHKFIVPFYRILSKCSKKTLVKKLSFTNLAAFDIMIFKILLTVKDPSAKNNRVIIIASKYGHHEIVKILLQDPRVDPSDVDNMAIRIASDNGQINIVKLLLQDSRVDPSANDNAAIRCASNNGHINVVKLLLQDSRVDPSADNNEAIRTSSRYGHYEIVKLLLQDSRFVVHTYDYRCDFGIEEAMESALYNGHYEIVKLLSFWHTQFLTSISS